MSKAVRDPVSGKVSAIRTDLLQLLLLAWFAFCASENGKREVLSYFVTLLYPSGELVVFATNIDGATKVGLTIVFFIILNNAPLFVLSYCVINYIKSSNASVF